MKRAHTFVPAIGPAILVLLPLQMITALHKKKGRYGNYVHHGMDMLPCLDGIGFTTTKIKNPNAGISHYLFLSELSFLRMLGYLDSMWRRARSAVVCPDSLFSFIATYTRFLLQRVTLFTFFIHSSI